MKREGGYTVLEAGLALGVSASLILLTIGLGSMVSRRRFEDSLTMAQSFIQAQYNEVRSGINARIGGTESDILGCGSNAAGNSEDCYSVGRLLTFGTDSGGNGYIKSSYVIAKVDGASKNEPWPSSDIGTGLDNLKDKKVSLYAVTSDSEDDGGLRATVKELGGNTIERAWYINGNPTEPEKSEVQQISPVSNSNLALLRSPLDGSMIVVANVNLSGANPDTGLQTVSLNNDDGKNTNYDENLTSSDKVVIGVANGGIGQQGGVICMSGGGSSGVTNNNNVNLGALSGSDVVAACGNHEE